MGKQWDVVGGADKGGILVREGQALKSVECADRLATGSVVEEIALIGERLNYRLVKGTGPREGWVSLKVGGKDLLAPAAAPTPVPSVTTDSTSFDLRPVAFADLPDHLKSAVPEGGTYPLPKGRCFGKDGKMKMLFLHGGGVSKTIGQMQINSLFKDWPESKKKLEWTIWTGPHKVPLGWNGDFSLKPFGPDFTVYFERLPFANSQEEHWDGIDKSISELKAFLKENGPFDGVVGFDMGGELLVHAAKLATEGDRDLQEKFRFMILFTTTAPKHLSPLGKQRIKAPLRIPAVCSWANSDENHPFMEYEELPLFIHRDFREVIVHEDGHKPPIFKKDQEVFHRMQRFLEAMHAGSDFIPSDHVDNTTRANLWLPLRAQPVQPLPSAASKRLLVVSDPMGPGDDLLKRLDFLKDLKSKGELPEIEGTPWVSSGTPRKPVERFQLLVDICSATHEAFSSVAGSSMSVEGVNYTDEHRKISWHCSAEQVNSRQLICKDIIEDESLDQVAKDVSRELLTSFERKDGEELCIVGLGTGAFIAFAIARMLVEDREYVPAALYLVNPPLRLPWSCTTVPGVLKHCPVHHLVDENSTYGPGWRYEVSTLGPFKCSVFDDMKEMVEQVVYGFKRR